MNRHLRLIAASLISASVLSLVLFLVFTQSPTDSADEQVISKSASADAVTSTSPVTNTLQSTSSKTDNRPEPQSAVAAFRPEIKLLLVSRPGYVSVLQASDMVAKLKTDAVNALPEMETLSKSTNVVERLLGLYMLLEINGPSEGVLNRASADVSAYVQSEAAAWLYLNGRFNEWDAFLRENCSSKSRDDLEAIFALLDTTPIRLDLPAAVSLLGLGRGLPDYVIEVFRRNAESIAFARQQLDDARIPMMQKENVLALLHQANPPDYTGILQSIIASSDDDHPLRWQAVWNYSQTASDVESRDFLSIWLDQHPRDRLRDKLEESSVAISERISAPELPVANLERRLKAAMSSKVAPDDDARSLFSHYIVQSMRETDHMAARDLLESWKAEYSDRTSYDRSFKQMLANIDYLIWRTQ